MVDTWLPRPTLAEEVHVATVAAFSRRCAEALAHDLTHGEADAGEVSPDKTRAFASIPWATATGDLVGRGGTSAGVGHLRGSRLGGQDRHALRAMLLTLAAVLEGDAPALAQAASDFPHDFAGASRLAAAVTLPPLLTGTSGDSKEGALQNLALAVVRRTALLFRERVAPDLEK
jgi:hypothetical protein